MKAWLVAMLTVAAITQLAAAAWIPTKACVAQALLERAWEAADATPLARPWLWADTWPVARLRSFKHDVDLIVLAGMTGRTLAFGPGHMSASALPGEHGTSVIGGHRDTHFEFLRRLRTGDRLLVERADGTEHWFRVTAIEVADSEHSQLVLRDDGAWLTLVTCYPFDAIDPGGPLRYVVTAQRLPRHAAVAEPTRESRTDAGWPGRGAEAVAHAREVERVD